MKLETIALAGGLWVVLVFWHFLADWLTQTEKNAEAKHHGGLVLGVHCLVYSALFIPFFWLYGLHLWEAVMSFIVLYFSHIVGDVGLPVWWWSKYIRKMTYTDMGKSIRVPVAFPTDLFRANEPMTTSKLFRPILVIVIDQLWHLAWLWVIVFFALYGRA